MRLKKLQLLGFKTFADKTEIEIGDGMTAIVGPNGSGKSNIVDALLWVLGEQNPRLLRGDKAQDVIFNGTDKRKPLGMAEVKLTLDNTDRTLPIDFTEVMVTRRVYRSGESQYLLNNAPCRLKDIVELFLDTGVGKGAYAFVSQSEIDAVLSAKPEDRRELFEEAAGIKKYRVKKREALRKLDAAEVNLHRVRDILHELEGQREPLERGALAARRYLLLQERLHEIEVGLLVSELQKADYERENARQERDEDSQNLLKLEADLARLERVSEEIGTLLAQIEGEMEAARGMQASAMARVERTQSGLSLMQERGKNALRTEESLGRELSEIEERIRFLTNTIERDGEDKAAAEAAEADKRGLWTRETEALRDLEAGVRNALREVEARQGERARQAQERAGREAALKGAGERLSEVKTRREKIGSEIALLKTSLAEAERCGQEAFEEIRTKTAEREAQEAAREKADQRRTAVQTRLAEGRGELDTLRRRLAEGSSRLNTLREMQENHEGFYGGVRAVLTAHKKRQIEGHYRAVVDLLTVPEPLRVAIEVALGGGLQDIVTDTEAEAKAGIRWLKENRAGRATFLPIPLLKPGTPLRVSPDARNGVLGSAAELVEFSPHYAKVADYLLGRVLLVGDMDAALASSRRLSGWSKMVTLEGELLTPGGALTGGSLGGAGGSGKGAHLVGRKGEMDDLGAALPPLKAALETQETALSDLSAELTLREAERGAAAKEEARLSAEIAAGNAAKAAAEREQKRLQEDLAERENAGLGIEKTEHSLTEEIARLTERLESGRVETGGLEDELSALNQETQTLIQKRDDSRAQAVKLEVEVGRLREKREGLVRSLASDRATLGGLQIQFEQKQALRAAARTEGTGAVEEREKLEKALREAQANLERTEGEFAALKEKRGGILNRNFEVSGAIKEITSRRTELSKTLHETELRLARLEVQIAAAGERLSEEYNLSREEALARPENAAIDRNTAMEVGRLRRELRGMGQVNTGAVAEFERLTERLDFLTGQRDDLQTGREQLLSTIAEIDDSTRGVFMETFRAVEREFEAIFARLFEGGTTKLTLTNPDDILETGIEVIAQPPGKKPQSLSLLSGGERALTATALLFSFLVVKPSPFVLLDEVDAPLDGVNVEKFTSLVKDFSERSQFLLITHNPVTMESAPSWYGVTMREAGVSSVLSYRLPQEATVSESERAVVMVEEREGAASVRR